MAKRKLQAHLELETEFGAMLGGNRIRLLEAIDKQGSISKAARSIPMSYKAAWDALEELNNLADEPVILRSIGGAGGGGTKLTGYGRKLVAMFRAVESEYQAAMDQLYRESDNSEATDKAAFQRLLRRITLRSSARNQFVGTVSRVVADSVDAQVFLSVDDDVEIEAHVTADSVRRLELAPGREVIALVKAPAVVLLTGKYRQAADTNYMEGVSAGSTRGRSTPK
jgi:molybdate transport system regulatory protein